MPQNKGTWIRFILLAVSLVSTGLVLLGKEPLEYDEVQLEQALTFLFTVGASVLAAYYNLMSLFSKKKTKNRLSD